jgi:hypothetical protein
MSALSSSVDHGHEPSCVRALRHYDDLRTRLNHLFQVATNAPTEELLGIIFALMDIVDDFIVLQSANAAKPKPTTDRSEEHEDKSTVEEKG